MTNYNLSAYYKSLCPWPRSGLTPTVLPLQLPSPIPTPKKSKSIFLRFKKLVLHLTVSGEASSIFLWGQEPILEEQKFSNRFHYSLPDAQCEISFLLKAEILHFSTAGQSVPNEGIDTLYGLFQWDNFRTLKSASKVVRERNKCWS